MFDAEAHWNKSHEKHPINRRPSSYAIDKEKLFPRNSTICDLGGGDGADSLFFLRQGHSVFLYDISESALNRAIQKAKIEGLDSKLSTAKVDLAKDKIPSDDGVFDIVYSRLVIHYFPRDQTIEILKEINRVLKDGGTAYVVVKSPEDVNEMNFLKGEAKEVENGIFLDNEGMTKTRFNKEQYEEMLKEAGIENFEVNNYLEHFGDQKVYVKSKADDLLYLELTIKKF